MDFPSPSSILSPQAMNVTTYSRLVSLLSKNDTWKRVAESFGIFSLQEMQNLCFNKEPAETLVFELGARLCTVEMLCEILKECNLHNILMLFKNFEPVNIIQQPTTSKKMITRGSELTLTCQATGIPPPCYQWYCDNEELFGQVDSTLCIKNFGSHNEGEYYCVVSQDGSDGVVSECTSAMLAPEPPVITQQPPLTELCHIGGKVTLNLRAQGHPHLKYQWFRGNSQLNGCTEPELTFSVTDESQEGTYRCYVNNTAGEVWSDATRVAIRESPRPEPSAKLALLFGNQLYDNLNHLNTPENDVKTMADLLKDLGFRVIALQNLRIVEMRNAVRCFSRIVPKDSYVVFYFSGHGFEMRDKFMLPVDAPGPEDFLQTHALCEKELLQAILGAQPKLFLELLDMCLKPPDPVNKKIFDEKTDLFEFEAKNNLIQGYATTSYLGAYETVSEKNGLYVEHLKEYLRSEVDMPVVEILGQVAKDIAKVCPMQQPFFGTNVTLDFRLSDRSRDDSRVALEMDKLSVVPKDFDLNFPIANTCSKVKFRPFMDTFANVLEVCFAHLESYTVCCETSGEELRFELSRVNGDVFLKVMNIQRLVTDKTLRLCLRNRNGRAVDSASWNIGKPLIAVADLWHEK